MRQVTEQLKKKDIERAYDYWQQWQPQTNLRFRD